jgi:hypothetical protein
MGKGNYGLILPSPLKRGIPDGRCISHPFDFKLENKSRAVYVSSKALLNP